MTWSNLNMDVNMSRFMYQMFGFERDNLNYETKGLFKAKAAYFKKVDVLEQHLAEREYLVGAAVTVADIAIFNTIYYPITMVLNDKERAKYPNVLAWFERIAQLDSFKLWWGRLRYNAKGMKFPKFKQAQPAPK